MGAGVLGGIPLTHGLRSKPLWAKAITYDLVIARKKQNARARATAKSIARRALKRSYITARNHQDLIFLRNT